MQEEEHPSRHRYAKGHEPLSCEQVALGVDEQEWEFVEWREGTNETLSGWFIALRLRAAHRDSSEKCSKRRTMAIG